MDLFALGDAEDYHATAGGVTADDLRVHIDVRIALLEIKGEDGLLVRAHLELVDEGTRLRLDFVLESGMADLVVADEADFGDPVLRLHAECHGDLVFPRFVDVCGDEVEKSGLIERADGPVHGGLFENGVRLDLDVSADQRLADRWKAVVADAHLADRCRFLHLLGGSGEGEHSHCEQRHGEEKKIRTHGKTGRLTDRCPGRNPIVRDHAGGPDFLMIADNSGYVSAESMAARAARAPGRFLRRDFSLGRIQATASPRARPSGERRSSAA